MRDTRKSGAIYEELDRVLTGPFRRLPLLTIFGERNDPLGFQPRWKQLFSGARQVGGDQKAITFQCATIRTSWLPPSANGIAIVWLGLKEIEAVHKNTLGTARIGEAK